MGPYGSLWDLYGSLCVAVDLYGISMGPYGVPMGLYRSLWSLYGSLWVSVGLYGVPMGPYVCLCVPMGPYGSL